MQNSNIFSIHNLCSYLVLLFSSFVVLWGYALYKFYCCSVNVYLYTGENVWEDIHPDSQEFIKEYLKQYPEVTFKEILFVDIFIATHTLSLKHSSFTDRGQLKTFSSFDVKLFHDHWTMQKIMVDISIQNKKSQFFLNINNEN